MCIYPILNLHIELDALYIDRNAVDIDLDTSQRSCDILFNHGHNHIRICVRMYLYNFEGV